jgi:methylglutaconyl-CoA hydratase
MDSTVLSNATTGSEPELEVLQDGPVLRLALNRPEKRNALSNTLVLALHQVISSVEPDGRTRVIVIAGNGPTFCAGGDIREFAHAASTGTAAAEAEGLANLFEAMTACPVPIIARIHGGAFGGGVGLVSAADIAIAESGTRFALSEARLGLVAAVISRYVIAALGWRSAKAHMLRGAPFDATEALRCDLVHEVVDGANLNAAVEAAINDVLACAPGALTTAKRLPDLIAGPDPTAVRTATIRILAGCLESDETQEGLRAFLEKRKPRWVPTDGGA